MAEETKVALITGSSSGIGEATARLLCKNGYRVVICGSNQEKVTRVVDECAKLATSTANKPIGLVLDLSVAENGTKAVEKTLDHFKRLDVLVNNAGIFKKTEWNHSGCYDDYKSVMNINLDATIKCSLAAAEPLKKTRGTMIFISSAASVTPLADSFGYCASKAAMSMFAKCLAIDLAPHVRVNIVSPGPVLTDIMNRFGKIDLDPVNIDERMKSFTLMERIGKAEEIAEAIQFLIGDKCSFIHGHELFIEGGLLLKSSITMPKQQEKQQ